MSSLHDNSKNFLKKEREGGTCLKTYTKPQSSQIKLSQAGKESYQGLNHHDETLSQNGNILTRMHDPISSTTLVQHEFPLRMRGGVVLSADIHWPLGSDNEPVPGVVLYREQFGCGRINDGDTFDKTGSDACAARAARYGVLGRKV